MIDPRKVVLLVNIPNSLLDISKVIDRIPLEIINNCSSGSAGIGIGGMRYHGTQSENDQNEFYGCEDAICYTSYEAGFV